MEIVSKKDGRAIYSTPSLRNECFEASGRKCRTGIPVRNQEKIEAFFVIVFDCVFLLILASFKDDSVLHIHD